MLSPQSLTAQGHRTILTDRVALDKAPSAIPALIARQGELLKAIVSI